MNFIKEIKDWKLDPWTMIVTTIVALLVIPLVRISCKGLIKGLGPAVSYTLDGIIFNITRRFKPTMAGALSLRRYCQLSRSDLRLSLLHVPSRNEITLDIDKAYVTLSLEQHASGEKVFSHVNLFEAGNRIRVIGDPGSGKSSLVKRLFRDACADGIRRPSASRLPILIELKTLVIPDEVDEKKFGDWFVETLRDEASKRQTYKIPDCFDAYRNGPGLLVLLDGLDEVASDRFGRLQKALGLLSRNLASDSIKNTVVITMRTQFHYQIKDLLREDYGPALFVRPFTPTEIYNFICRWDFKGDKENHVNRIYRDLTDRPSLREMCSNPLVLAMYAARDQESEHPLTPESRTDFYKSVADELIIKRRHRQQVEVTAIQRLRDQRERILGRLAFEHMLDAMQPANTLDWETAILIVQSEFKSYSKEKAEYVLREIAKETGLLSEERSRETLRFIHLTFCEFFAAMEAIAGQRNGFKTLIARHVDLAASGRRQDRSRLLEIIPFACGLIARVDKVAAMEMISRIGDLPLQGRCFLETKLYDHPTWPSYVDSQKVRLLSIGDLGWKAEWLRELHLFGVVVRDAVLSAKHDPGINASAFNLKDFYRKLINRKSNMETILSAFAEQDAAAAFLVAEYAAIDLSIDFPEIIVTHCDQPPFLALVCERLRMSRGRETRWAALLGEAALRSTVVARQLAEMRPEPILLSTIQTIPPKMRWKIPRSEGDNLLSQTLNIIHRESPYDFLLTKVFSKCSPPEPAIGELNRLRILLILLMFVIALGLLRCFTADKIQWTYIVGISTSEILLSFYMYFLLYNLYLLNCIHETFIVNEPVNGFNKYLFVKTFNYKDLKHLLNLYYINHNFMNFIDYKEYQKNKLEI